MTALGTGMLTTEWCTLHPSRVLPPFVGAGGGYICQSLFDHAATYNTEQREGAKLVSPSPDPKAF